MTQSIPGDTPRDNSRLSSSELNRLKSYLINAQATDDPGRLKAAQIYHRYQKKLNEAEQYRQRIQQVVDQQRSGVLRDRLKATTVQVYDWIANMVALARRIDTFRSDAIIQRDLRTVPEEIRRLEGRLNLERDPRVREQMQATLVSSREQWDSLRELKGRMDRADLQLDHSLASLGTVYSQMLLIGSKDVDSDRTERLRDDIAAAALALADPEDGAPIFQAAFRREELYHGPYLEQAADLILAPYDGYDPKGPLYKETLTFKGDQLVGAHTYDDAMLYVAGQQIPQTRFSVVDVMPTMLSLMGVGCPPGMDGRSLV